MDNLTTRDQRFLAAGFEKVTQEALENLHKRNSNVNKNAREGIAKYKFFNVYINKETWEITLDSDKRMHNYIKKPVLNHYKMYDFIEPGDVLARVQIITPGDEDEPDQPTVEKTIKADVLTVHLAKWDNHPLNSPERVDGVYLVIETLKRAKKVLVQFDYEGPTRHELAAHAFMEMMRQMGFLNVRYEIGHNYEFSLSGTPDRAESDYAMAIQKLKEYARFYPNVGGAITLIVHHYIPTKTRLSVAIQSDAREYDSATNDSFLVPHREYIFPVVNRSNADTVIQVMAAHLKDLADSIYYRFHTHTL